MTRLAKPLDIEREFVEYRRWHEDEHCQLKDEDGDSSHHRVGKILTLIHRPVT